MKKIDLNKINAIANNATMQTAAKPESNISIDKILPNPYQPRFTEENIEELATSIQNDGLLQPIAVRKNNDNTFTLIAGHRRFAAVKTLGHKEIKANIISDVDDKKLCTLAMIENIQREQLHPIEIATTIDNLIKQGFCTSQDEVADLFAKSKVWVSKMRSLLKLEQNIINDLVDKKPKIGAETLSELAKVESSKQLEVYNEITNMENPREYIQDIIKKQKLKDVVSTAKLSFDISQTLDKEKTHKAISIILKEMEKIGIEAVLKKMGVK